MFVLKPFLCLLGKGIGPLGEEHNDIDATVETQGDDVLERVSFAALDISQQQARILGVRSIIEQLCSSILDTLAFIGCHRIFGVHLQRIIDRCYRLSHTSRDG